MKRLLVNDCLSTLGEVTFWHRLCDWFGMEFVGGDYATLAEKAGDVARNGPADLIIRNATWFGPMPESGRIPTIALLQDISPDGETRKMQESVARTSTVVFNSAFTAAQYPGITGRVIPLPIDFAVFTPQNAFACQQALSLPDGCVCWVGASQGAAGHVKGFDTFLQIVRLNPDISFVGVFKDAAPESVPPNLRVYARLPQADLVKVIGACRVGLCTSRTESQHLAGIEMGVCGLPLVVPPVGCYWQRKDWPGCEALESTPAAFTQGIRASIGKVAEKEKRPVSDYWRKEFDIEVVRAAWTKLVEEVECSGR